MCRKIEKNITLTSKRIQQDLLEHHQYNLQICFLLSSSTLRKLLFLFFTVIEPLLLPLLHCYSWCIGMVRCLNASQLIRYLFNALISFLQSGECFISPFWERSKSGGILLGLYRVWVSIYYPSISKLVIFKIVTYYHTKA